MKAPSKNIPMSLRNQAAGSTIPDNNPVVTKQTPATAAGMILPGEGCVESPPGMVSERSAQGHAKALGGKFGGAC